MSQFRAKNVERTEITLEVEVGKRTPRVDNIFRKDFQAIRIDPL